MSYEHKCQGCGKDYDSFSPKQALCFRCEEKKIQTLFPEFTNEAARDLMYLATCNVYCNDNANLLHRAAKELESLHRKLNK
jgi:hypothetical protein